MMRLSRSRVATCLAVLFGLAAMAPGMLSAQKATNRAPFTFVLADTFTYRDAEAVIVRRPGRAPHDLIIVDRNHVRASLLSESANLLLVARDHYGEEPKDSMLIRVPRPTRTRQFQQAATDWAVKLERAPRRQVPGFGLGSTITVNLK